MINNSIENSMLGKEITVLLDTFRRLIRRKANSNIKKLLNKTHSADLAQLFRYFNNNEKTFLFNLLQKNNEASGELLSELDESIISDLLLPLQPIEVANILRKMGSDDIADILNLLDQDKAQLILEKLKNKESEELEELMSYPDDSAGGLMSFDVFSLPESTKAIDAITSIQNYKQAEMVFYLYVTDENSHLTGVVSLRDLVTAPPDSILKSFMEDDVVFVSSNTDQEEVAKLVSKYNLLAIPVIDSDRTLLGIITVDDVVEFQVFDSFNVGDAIQANSSEQTLAGNLTVTGTLDVLSGEAGNTAYIGVQSGGTAVGYVSSWDKVRPFFQYGFSADGQLDVSSVGYVPLPENIRQEALELIN